MTIGRKYLLFIIFITLLASVVRGQGITLKGSVVDNETDDILPFVNLSFSNCDDGGITDLNGEFSLHTNCKSDTLIVSFIGYDEYKFPITKHNQSGIKIRLQPSVMKLGEVVIRAGVDPAMILLKLIKDKRKDNKLGYIDYYSYDVYNKLEFDLNNLRRDFSDAALLKPFEFLNDYIDTADVSGKAYLPFFISETFSTRYYNNERSKELEVITGNKISGINNESLRRYTGDMYQDVNIYDHTISVLGKDFISPIGRLGKAYYNYTLSDTAWVDSRYCYKLEFEPKRKYEPTMEGYVWVNDTSFAVKSFRISLSQTASINFVDSLVAEKHFIEVSDSVWMVSYDNLFVDFNLFNETEGFFGRKTSYYTNHKLNGDVNKEVFDRDYATNLVYETDKGSETDEFWDEKRPEKLSDREKAIYHMVDTIQEIKAFRVWEDIVTILASGYYITGPIELGPVFSFVSHNPIEGNRLRFGLRTSNDFSKKILFEGYGAYGFGDKQWKYSGGSSYMFSTLPRRALHLHFAHDYIQMGSGLNALRTDNLLGTLLRRPGEIHMHYADQGELLYEHEFHEGFSAYFGLESKRIYSPKTSQFYLLDQSAENRATRFSSTDFIQSSEIIIGMHWAKDEKFIRGSFEQVSLGTKKPMLNFKLAYSPPKFFNNLHEYLKVTLNLRHKIRLAPFGTLHYAIETGKVHGKTYYPFLFVHRGNQSFAYYDFAFNLMNYYEFVSDQYISFYAEQRFEGFFLNHLPLLRRLNWREHIGFKATYGELGVKSKRLMFYPDFISDFTTDKGKPLPYMEVNVGVSNIFKVLRLDAVWRLSHLHNQNIYPFAITAKLQIAF